MSALSRIADYVARDTRAVPPGQVISGHRTARPGAAAGPQRPAVEYFNVADFTNTDAKGFVRPVERFQVEQWGLYMARTVDGPHFHYLESWLLPELSIRVSAAHARPGDHHAKDHCLDIGEFTRIEPKRWKAVDHYLDVMVPRDGKPELRGVADLLAAHAAGLLDTAQADRAFERATAALDGIAAHEHSLDSWLASLDIRLTWM